MEEHIKALLSAIQALFSAILAFLIVIGIGTLLVYIIVLGLIPPAGCST